MLEFPDSENTQRIRPTFVATLSRMALTLGFAHFLCVPLIYVFRGDSPDAAYAQYAWLVTATGLLLLLVAFLCRYQSLVSKLPYLCFGVLFVQAAILLFHEKTLFHPFAMLFPLLVSLGAPILGRYRSFGLGAFSNLLFFSYALIFAQGNSLLLLRQLPSLALLLAIVVVSAYIAESLWSEILVKEQRLREALEDASNKAEEMERWVQRLGQASSLISDGNYAVELPEPLPHRVFVELTRSVEQMQERLRQYFGDLLLKDRLTSLGVLATGVAHELNTPLTTIQFIMDSDEQMAKETRERIENQIQHLSSIAKGLLSFAWQKGDENFDLNDVVRSSETLMRYSKREGLAIDVDLCQEPLPIHGAGNQIQQVLMNLFNNSVDALEGRPSQQVWIRTTRLSTGHGHLVFRDNGCGMSKETLSRILDPFFTTKIGKGTGLGMFMVHQILKNHGAAIEVESEAGQGTTIRIQFPLSVSASGAGSTLSKVA